MMSFAVTPGLQRAVHLHLVGFRLALQQALRRQHVLHFAGADAERERAERAVRRGVAVAADDRHAGLREALLGSDDVDDALLVAVEAVSRECRTPCSWFRAAPPGSPRSCPRSAAIAAWSECCGRWWRCVRSGRRTLKPRSRKSGEGLRRCHFVDQVQIDVDQRRSAGLLGDDVGVPDFFDDGAWLTHDSPRLRRQTAVAHFASWWPAFLPASGPP